jgi:hypothetical protein
MGFLSQNKLLVKKQKLLWGAEQTAFILNLPPVK